MTRAKPKAGETWTYEGQEELGSGVGADPIRVGQEVTVREIVDADEVGAHDDSEDAVVVEAVLPHLTYDEETGEPTIGTRTQAWSVGLEEFQNSYQKVGS